MYNRTLNRPMFRRGGRAGGGIMTGVDRQGYDGTDGNQIVVKNDPTKFQSDAEFLKKNIGERPEIKPYPYKGSDFFMGLGANILAQPGGQPIFQTIGQAGINPLKTLAAQNLADYGNQQKNKLGKYQDNKDLIMSVYKNMDDDDKILLEKQMDFFMSKEGGNMTQAEALEHVLFRKSKSPTDVKRDEKLGAEKLTIDRVDDLVKLYEIGRPDAVVLNKFFNDIESQKFEVPHDPEQYFIDDGDVGRGTTDAEKRLVIRDYDPEQSDYKEGRVYIDFITKKAFVKQGQYLIPYEDYISETISTD